MAEITVKSGENDNTIAADIGTAGVHIFTDKGFFDRVQDISLFFSNYLTDEEIKARTNSSVRQNVLKRSMRAAEYVFSQSAYGKGAERPRVLRGLQSVNDLLLAVEECVDSDINDEDCALVCRDIINHTLKVPPALFDSQNTSINKAFTVQGPMQPHMQAPVMTPVQQLTGNSEKPSRSGGEYAGRNPQQ